MAEEYSDEQLEAILERVHQWGKEWWDARSTQDLTEDEREQAEFVIGTFAEYMYSYHGLAPEEWDEAGLEECCLETLPRKISAEEPYYAAIAPVLSSFFTYLAETGRLHQGARLARKVRSISRRIVEHGMDPRHWGMAKSLMMGAFAAGVDIQDEAAMQNYIAQYNAALSRGPAPEPLLPALEPTQPVRVTKIGRNEPCPCGSGKKYKKCCGR